jgi:GT2 family glycosyltransferase
VKQTAVVILNWNGKDFLEKFLPEVVAYSREDAEIIVADNNSSDDSVSFLQDNFPEIRIIQNKENGGFAKGYNDALKKVDAKYYILLNSDIEVSPNWINPLYKLMEENEDIAACQPKLIDYNNKSKFEYAGAAGGFIDYLGFPFCRGRIFFNLEEDKAQYNDTTEVFWATGACLMIRSELYHKNDGLDEDFFAHMEEIDLCWRLKNQGHKIYYCGESTVYHVGGGTLPKSNSKKTYLNFRNNYILLLKNLPRQKIFAVFFLRFILDQIASLKFLFTGGFKDFIAVHKAYFHFLRKYKTHKKKRLKNIHSYPSKTYQKSIVWQHYLKGKKTYKEINL